MFGVCFTICLWGKADDDELVIDGVKLRTGTQKWNFGPEDLPAEADFSSSTHWPDAHHPLHLGWGYFTDAVKR